MICVWTCEDKKQREKKEQILLFYMNVRFYEQVEKRKEKKKIDSPHLFLLAGPMSVWETFEDLYKLLYIREELKYSTAFC